MEGHKLARLGLALCGLTFGLGIAFAGSIRVGYKCDPNFKCEKCENVYDSGGTFLYSCKPKSQTFKGCVSDPSTNCPLDGTKECEGEKYAAKDCPGIASGTSCGPLIYDKCQ